MSLRTVFQREHQQAVITRRVMFTWVASAAAVVSFVAVTGWYLVQYGIFRGAVLSEKSATVQTLRQNKENIPQLQGNVRRLNTDEGLLAARATERDRPLQTVLDALPSSGNSVAFASSLQTKLFGNLKGVTVVSIQVDPSAEELSSSTGATVRDTTAAKDDAIVFRATLSGTADGLKQALLRLERSIRAINVTALKVDTRQNGRVTLSIEGEAPYMPAKTVDLKDKEVRP